MQKKIIASFCLFAVVYLNQHASLTKTIFTNDFSFASFAAAYEARFGTLLPAMNRTSIVPASFVSTNSPLAAEKDGVVIRINNENISIQQDDGTEVEVSGLEPDSYRLFERIKQGEPIGTPSGSIIEFVERKNGQTISSRKVNVHE
ncbi:hypothetical protein NLX67_09350 [Domibacillus sp. A3M-37]|uniref:hypothetical protein n=1 Tax=Domibacillus TaxID=1433999 RepID=UPI000617B7C3|nr:MULTISPECIES: hypothetical protein [Domibacillus]MCP3762594.1 hypothetical protein [Domibacillus sp. A3M-37]